MALEICIYLAIAFGVLILCITMLEKDECIEASYIIVKRDDAKVKVIVEADGLSEEDTKRIGWIIRRGKFQDIYDIVNDFDIICKQEE